MRKIRDKKVLLSMPPLVYETIRARAAAKETEPADEAVRLIMEGLAAEVGLSRREDSEVRR